VISTGWTLLKQGNIDNQKAPAEFEHLVRTHCRPRLGEISTGAP
jgi:hypothetical protein